MPSYKKRAVYVMHFRFRPDKPWFTREFANETTARAELHALRKPYEAYLMEGTPIGHGKHVWRTLEYVTD